MLKQLSRLGEPLDKIGQKAINGGGRIVTCEYSADPSTDWCCHLPQGCP